MRKSLKIKLLALALSILLVVTIMPLDKVFSSLRADGEASVTAVWDPTGENISFAEDAVGSLGYNPPGTNILETKMVTVNTSFPADQSGKKIIVELAPGIMISNNGVSTLSENQFYVGMEGPIDRTNIYSSYYYQNGKYIYSFDDGMTTGGFSFQVMADNSYFVDEANPIINNAIKVSIVADGEEVGSTSINISRGQLQFKSGKTTLSGNVVCGEYISKAADGAPMNLNTWYGGYTTFYYRYAEVTYLLPAGVSVNMDALTERTGGGSSTNAVAGFSVLSSTENPDGTTTVVYRRENFSDTTVGCQPIVKLDPDVFSEGNKVDIKCTEIKVLPYGNLTEPLVYAGNDKTKLVYTVIDNDEKIVICNNQNVNGSNPIPTYNTSTTMAPDDQLDAQYLLGRYSIWNAGAKESAPKKITFTFVEPNEQNVGYNLPCGVTFAMLTGQKNMPVGTITYTVYDKDQDCILPEARTYSDGTFDGSGQFFLTAGLIDLGPSEYLASVSYNLDYDLGDGTRYGLKKLKDGCTTTPNYSTIGGTIFDLDRMKSSAVQTASIEVVDLYEDTGNHRSIGIVTDRVSLTRSNNENYITYVDKTNGQKLIGRAGGDPLSLSVVIGSRQTSNTSNPFFADYDKTPVIYIRDVYATDVDSRTISNISIVNKQGVDIIKTYGDLIDISYHLDNTGHVVARIDTSALASQSQYSDRYAAAIGYFDRNDPKEHTLTVSWDYSIPLLCSDTKIYNLADVVFLSREGTGDNSASSTVDVTNPYAVTLEGDRPVVKSRTANMTTTFQAVVREDIAIATSGRREDASGRDFESWNGDLSNCILIEPGAKFIIKNDVYNNSGRPTSTEEGSLNYIFIPVPYENEDWGELNSGVDPNGNPTSAFTYTMTLNSAVENPDPEHLTFEYAKVDLESLGIQASSNYRTLGNSLLNSQDIDWDDGNSFDANKQYNIIKVAISGLPASTASEVPALCLDVTPTEDAVIGSINVFQALYYESITTVNNMEFTGWASSGKLALQVTKGTISGYVWKDSNGDGIMQDTEAGVEGVKVTLTSTNVDPIYEAGSNHSTVVTSGADGYFEFPMLPSGEYNVTFEQGSGADAIKFEEYMASPVDATANETVDSDATPTYDAENTLTGAAINTIDIPYYPNGSKAEFERGGENFGLVPSVTVQYNLVGNTNPDGAVAPEDETIISGSEYTAQTVTQTFTGYKFLGWFTNSGCSIKFKDGSAVTPAGNGITYQLYGKWVPISYEVTFDSNVPTDCPTTVDGTMQNQTHVYNSSLALTNNGFDLPGYEFQGWAITADGSVTYDNKDSVTNLSDTDGDVVTLYAVWAPKTITITYVLKYDTDGKPETDTQTAEFNTAISLREGEGTGVKGYASVSWNTEEDGSGTSFGFGASTTPYAVSPNGEDVKLYAVRELTGYIIRYYANSGDVYGDIPDSVESFDEPAILADNAFTRDNYSFIGWNTKDDGTGTFYNALEVVDDPLTTTPKEIVVLYAIWQGDPCTIHFVKNAANAIGTDYSMIEQPFESEITLPANRFTYTGYHFDGWNTAADGTGQSFCDEEVTIHLTLEAGSETTLYAQWAPNSYIVEYIANGGTGSMTSTDAYYDEEFSLKPNEFTCTGYTFIGWATSDGGAVVYTDAQTNLINLTTGNDEIITLYAVWSANTYTIAFDGNGNDGGSMTSINATYAVDVPLPANGFTRTGYTFTGWKLGDQDFADKAVVENLATSGEVTLVAQWTANSYTIKFDANGGVGTMDNQPMTYDVAANLTANTFTREGYVFAGWKLDTQDFADKASVKNLTPAVNGEVTLKAQWTPNTYVVKFDANGGTGTMDNQPMTYDVASDLTANAFTREGYTFTGWKLDDQSFADKASVKNLTSAVNGEVTLQAQWSANNYTIVYNANGAEGTMPNQPMVYDTDPVALYNNAFTRTGYTFKGWATSADGNVVYANAAAVKNLAASGEFNLYAVWSVNHYHIRFVENGGTGTPMDDIDNVAYDAEVVIPANEYTRTGYTFTGWNTKADGTGTAYAVGDKVTKLAALDNLLVFLYAQWTPNNYTIIYNGNGATDGSMSNQPMVYDASAVKLYANGFTRTGYVFAGWSTTADGNVEYADSESVQNLTSVPGGEFNLYAVWSANSYTISYDANGAEGEMDDTDATYDVEVKLTENEFSLTGYTFMGWALTEDGDVEFEDGDSVMNLTSDVDGAVTLYAIWAPNHFTVVFDANGGEGEMDDLPMIYDAEDEIPTTEDYARDGYFFIGWAEDAEQPYPDYVRGQKIMNLATEEGAVVTLYAVWQEGAYISVFAEDNGEAVADANYIMSGNDVAVTITPDEGYRIASITNNEEPIDRAELVLDDEGNFVYTLENVKGNNEIVVTFEAKPSETDCDLILADGNALEFFVNDPIKLTAIGAWEDDELLLEGDVKFVPSNWHHANPSGDWDGKDDASFDYSDTFTQPAAGRYTVHAEFDKYIYTAGEWIKDSTVTLDADYIVKVRPAVPTAVPSATPTATPAPDAPVVPGDAATATPTATPTPAGGTVATGESASALPYIGGAMIILAAALVLISRRKKEQD